MSVLTQIVCMSLFVCLAAARVSGQEHRAQVSVDTLDINVALAFAEKHLNLKHLDSARAAYMQILAASNMKRYRYGIVKSLNGLGNVYAEKGDYRRALPMFTRALSYYDAADSGILSVMAMVHNNIGSVYLQWNDYEQAIRHYVQAIRLHEQTGSELHTSYSNMAVLMLKVQEPEKSLQYLEMIEKKLTRDTNRKSLITVLLHKSRVYDVLGDTSRSDSCLYKVITLAETYNDKSMAQFTALVNLAGAAVDRNQADRAMAYLQRASEKISTANHYYQVYFWNISGAAYVLKKQYAQARISFQKALAMAQEYHNLRGISESYKWLNEVSAAQGHFSDAYKYRLEYRRIEDSIYAKDNIATTLGYEARYQMIQKDRQILEKEQTIRQQKDELRIRNIWIAGSGATALLLILVLIFIRKNHKYRQAWREEEIQSLIRQQELGEMKAIMKGEEKERTRIAHDLHEGIMHGLSGIINSIETLRGQHTAQPAGKLTDISREIDRTAAQIRITAHNLMPDMLLEEGISEAVFYFCNQLERTHSVKIIFEEISELGRFDPFFELTVYRIIQKILQYAAGDMHTTEIYLQMNYDNRLLHITIEDNNTGRPPMVNGLYTSRNTALEVIRARVLLLNGIMEIDNSQENGTSVNLEFEVARVSEKEAERNETNDSNS